jgi:hypothetical protein
MASFASLQSYFSDGGTDAVEKYEPLENGNIRVHFNDGHVSDWRVTTDPDTGDVLDAYCYNDVL